MLESLADAIFAEMRRQCPNGHFVRDGDVVDIDGTFDLGKIAEVASEWCATLYGV